MMFSSRAPAACCHRRSAVRMQAWRQSSLEIRATARAAVCCNSAEPHSAVAARRRRPYVPPWAGDEEMTMTIGIRAIGRPRRPALAVRPALFCARLRRRRRPARASLPAHRAVYDLKLAQHARQASTRGGARPHSLRFLRQRLRRLCAAIPPGVGARQRRGQGRAQRPARDHLGGRRRPRAALPLAELSRRAAGRCRSTARPSGRARRRGEADQAGDKKLDLEADDRCSRPSTCAASSTAAREGKSCWSSRSMTAPTPARRSTTR